MNKILTIVGARPQFVKSAVVSIALAKHCNLKELILHTGQHYDANLSQIFFDELGIPSVDFQLSVGSGLHGEQTAEMLKKIETVIINEKPDWVLVYGDTNSTLAGALAAAKLRVPVAHVESGLRSFNKSMPEEINRIVTDHLSDVLFVPTGEALLNLEREGISGSKVVETGDVMYDSALLFSKAAKNKSSILQCCDLLDRQYILTTLHRAENTDNRDRLLTILSALNKVAETHPIVMPLHPRTRAAILRYNIQTELYENIQCIDPVGFMDMLMLEKNASLIVTDSGGVQKEAFFYQVPCVTLRSETEWVETIRLKWNRIVCPSEEIDSIVKKIIQAIGSKGLSGFCPFGKGDAANKIADFFSNYSPLSSQKEIQTCEFG